MCAVLLSSNSWPIKLDPSRLAKKQPPSARFILQLKTAGASRRTQEFKHLARAIMEVLGKPNLADFFPIMSYFDPFGIRRDTETYFRKLFVVFDDIIKQRLSADPSSTCAEDDVLAALLKISKESGSDLSLDDIKHLLLDMFVAGTDTTSGTLEWVMTELLRNPEKMLKAQAELDQVLGRNGAVQELDIERLPYLQAVVKETLRVHPPGPFLIPHKAVNDVDISGYVVPRNSQLLVNIWAIGRDPDSWESPAAFLPERFMESDIDVRGQHFELIPFGAGRRMCPGLPLAYRMLHLMLATLVHGFNWKLENGVRGEDVDMGEKVGLTLQRANPLLAVPLAR